jgi:hypothetical protein
VLVQAASCAPVLVMSFAFMRIYGIGGVGLAWLASQTAVATTVLVKELRSIVASMRLREVLCWREY